jgi:hypothetical protein
MLNQLPIKTSNTQVQQIFEDQRKIGWHHWLYGRWAKSWKKLCHCDKTISKIQKSIIELAHQAWRTHNKLIKAKIPNDTEMKILHTNTHQTQEQLKLHIANNTVCTETLTQPNNLSEKMNMIKKNKQYQNLI